MNFPTTLAVLSLDENLVLSLDENLVLSLDENLGKKNENILNIWIFTDGISADGVFTVSVLTNCVFTDGTIFKTINIIIVVEMNIIHDETATTYAVDELEK